MLNRTSKHVRDCHARAADCRQRADTAVDDETRAFWLSQEKRWLRLAGSKDLSARISTFVDDSHHPGFSPEAEAGVAALVRIFNQACIDLNLDLSDETLPRKVARTIIKVAIEGESDPDVLLAAAIKAVSN